MKLEQLYDEYLDILKFEIDYFNHKPTELRHLIGRLGEIYCAIKTKGSLAQEVNQQGHDVIAKDGSKISVKTTVQNSGFITLDPKTLDRVDKIMIVMYENNSFKDIYFGLVQPLIENTRMYDNKYEIDISKIKKVANGSLLCQYFIRGKISNLTKHLNLYLQNINIKLYFQ